MTNPSVTIVTFVEFGETSIIGVYPTTDCAKDAVRRDLLARLGSNDHYGTADDVDWAVDNDYAYSEFVVGAPADTTRAFD